MGNHSCISHPEVNRIWIKTKKNTTKMGILNIPPMSPQFHEQKKQCWGIGPMSFYLMLALMLGVIPVMP